jgi:hypothetical protein
MRSLAERANLLATPSGFWKRELLGAVVGRQLVLPNVHKNRDSGFCEHKIRPPEEMYVAPPV